MPGDTSERGSDFASRRVPGSSAAELPSRIGRGPAQSEGAAERHFRSPGIGSALRPQTAGPGLSLGSLARKTPFTGSAP
jgi:hypothetical protein